MYQAIIVLHVLVALAIIGLVMIQRGRGADAGAGFGGGSSNTFFGARGAATFLSKTTAIMAAVFFSTSLALAYLADRKDNKPVDIMDGPANVTAPADLPPPAAGEKPSAPVDVPTPSDLPAPPD